jgi:hypothetical protein
MVFGSDQRADLSGVPAEFQPGKAKSPAAPQVPSETAAPQSISQSQFGNPLSPFRSLLRFAIWTTIGMGVIFALALFKIVLAGSDPADSADSQATAPAPGAAEGPAHVASETQPDFGNAMQSAAAASDLARRQQEEAMKAVAAARALAKDPESREAQAALEEAMRKVQAISEEASR